MAALLLRKKIFYNQLRSLHRSAVAFNIPTTLNMYKNKEKFQEVFPEVMDSLMTSSKFTKQLPEVGSWVKQLLNYTLHEGRRSKGLAVAFAYEMLEDPKHFTEEKLHTARFLGWCVEIVQAYLQVVDDIMDVSTTRRGKPCWYLQPNVGTSAINDSILINQSLMELLEINFGNETFYADVVKRINEEIMHTVIGYYLDHSSVYTKDKNNLDGFTMEKFTAIAIQKNGHFSILLPVHLALLLVKNGKEKDTTDLNSICCEFSKLLQLQNDYKDLYYDEATTGKAGSDIQEGKLTWLAVTALERCNETQRSIFKENYGSKDPEDVKRIRQLYDELQIDKVSQKTERTLFENLKRRICALPTEGETQLFLEILEACRIRIY